MRFLSCLVLSMTVLLVSVGSAFAVNEKGMFALESGDYKQAMRIFKPDADKGDAESMYYYAKTLLTGTSDENLHKEAIRYVERGIAMGSISCMNLLGHAYDKGLGVRQDSARAVQYYTQAIEAYEANPSENIFPAIAYGKALGNLAAKYFDGDGVPGDRISGLVFNLFSLSYGLANTASSKNVEEGLKERIDYFGKRNFEQAFEQMSPMFWGMWGTKRTKDDPLYAYKYIKKSADSGSLTGLMALAYCHAYGIGVQKDPYKGLELAKQAVNAKPLPEEAIVRRALDLNARQLLLGFQFLLSQNAAEQKAIVRKLDEMTEGDTIAAIDATFVADFYEKYPAVKNIKRAHELYVKAFSYGIVDAKAGMERTKDGRTFSGGGVYSGNSPVASDEVISDESPQSKGQSPGVVLEIPSLGKKGVASAPVHGYAIYRWVETPPQGIIPTQIVTRSLAIDDQQYLSGNHFMGFVGVKNLVCEKGPNSQEGSVLTAPGLCKVPFVINNPGKHRIHASITINGQIKSVNKSITVK